MALTSAQKTQYINDCRDAAKTLIQGINALRNLRKQWDALDMGNTLQNSDFVDENVGIGVQDVMDVLGTSLDSIESLLNAGHGTNLYKLKY